MNKYQRELGEKKAKGMKGGEKPGLDNDEDINTSKAEYMFSTTVANDKEMENIASERDILNLPETKISGTRDYAEETVEELPVAGCGKEEERGNPARCPPLPRCESAKQAERTGEESGEELPPKEGRRKRPARPIAEGSTDANSDVKGVGMEIEEEDCILVKGGPSDNKNAKSKDGGERGRRKRGKPLTCGVEWNMSEWRQSKEIWLRRR